MSSERVECKWHCTCQPTSTESTNNVTPCIGEEWAQVTVGEWGRRMLGRTFRWWMMCIWWVMIDSTGGVEKSARKTAASRVLLPGTRLR